MKMTVEQPPIEVSEVTEDELTAYEQSASQLFELLDSCPPESEGAYFYKATWDESGLTSATRALIAPTGARRQERFGEFYQAQFRVTEESAESEEIRRRFIWSDTGPSRPGTPIKPDHYAMYNQYDYDSLNAKSIALTLLQRVESRDDCIALVSRLQGREVDIESQLARRVNAFTARFVNHDFLEHDSEDIVQGARKLFELLNLCQDFGQDISRWTQGFLVSSLLPIAAGKPRKKENQLKPEGAMNIIEAAIHENVIHGKRALERIYGCTQLYKYPVSTELLHAQLSRENGNRGIKNVFGVERGRFAMAYITNLLQGQQDQLPKATKNYVANTKIDPSKIVKHEELYAMLAELVCTVDGPGAADEFVNERAVGAIFDHLLSLIHSDPDEAQAEFDQKAVSIVEAVMAPLLAQKIGKQALLDKDEIEE